MLKNSQGQIIMRFEAIIISLFFSLQVKTAPKNPPKDVIKSSNGITITVTLMHVQHYTKQKYTWVGKVTRGHKRS